MNRRPEKGAKSTVSRADVGGDQQCTKITHPAGMRNARGKCSHVLVRAVTRGDALFLVRACAFMGMHSYVCAFMIDRELFLPRRVISAPSIFAQNSMS